MASAGFEALRLSGCHAMAGRSGRGQASEKSVAARLGQAILYLMRRNSDSRGITKHNIQRITDRKRDVSLANILKCNVQRTKKNPPRGRGVSGDG